MRIALVLLAAGSSRRMGRDKLSLVLEGKPLYLYAIELLAAVPGEQRIIVTNNPNIRAAGEAHGFTVLENPDAPQGIGTSVAVATRAVDADFALYLNCDQPLLTTDCVEKLIAAAKETGKIVVPVYQGKHKSPCIFPRRFYPQLIHLREDNGGRAVYRHHPEEVHFVEFTEMRPFWDVDTPEEWEKMQRCARQEAKNGTLPGSEQ